MIGKYKMLQLDNPSCDFWAVLFQTLFSVVQELRKRDDKLMLMPGWLVWRAVLFWCHALKFCKIEFGWESSDTLSALCVHDLLDV